MTIAQTEDSTRQKPLRLWPGVLIVVLQWLAWLVAPFVLPESLAGYVSFFGRGLGGLAIVVWWAFFSRAPRLERWGALVLMIVGLAATPRLLHESVAKGNFGVQFFAYAIPALSLALVVWAAASRRLAPAPRRVTMVVAILLACGVWTLVRSEGITGDGAAEFAWRWAATPEERLLARAGDESAAPESALAPALLPTETGAEWAGFRGSQRDGVIPGLRIATDWSRTPPVELWRRPIGPGVSSLAVGGDLLYTHEQRGEDEIVACHRVATGEPVWRHRDRVRFWDSHVGAGPRATPALSDGRVYTFGATGILNALDAADGTVIWSRSVPSDTDAKEPDFGFTSSPLVVDDLVIVVAGRLAAYDLATGEPRWLGPAHTGSYSSPQLATLDGVEQVLLLSGAGAISVAPADGTLLWEHPPGIGITQPALTADGDLLIGMVSDFGPTGTLRLAVARGPGGWTAEERWTSTGLKPYFSPLVVHRDHAYGFDGRILASIDLADGRRAWKGGRYGSGQLLLLPDQDLLLVVSEQGELALVLAAPDRFTEMARFPAIEGKTWSQPTLVGDLLLLRNREEMAAFRLPLEAG